MWIKAPHPAPGLGLFSQLSVHHGSRHFCPPPPTLSLGMSGIPSQTLASPLPKASPSPQGIHQLWPFRNVLTPGTTRARKSRLIPKRIHHSSQRKSLQRAMEGSCPDLPIWPGQTDGWTDGWRDGRTDGQTDRWLDGWMEGQTLPGGDGKWPSRTCSKTQPEGSSPPLGKDFLPPEILTSENSAYLMVKRVNGFDWFTVVGENRLDW